MKKGDTIVTETAQYLITDWVLAQKKHTVEVSYTNGQAAQTILLSKAELKALNGKLITKEATQAKATTTTAPAATTPPADTEQKTVLASFPAEPNWGNMPTPEPQPPAATPPAEEPQPPAATPPAEEPQPPAATPPAEEPQPPAATDQQPINTPPPPTDQQPEPEESGPGEPVYKKWKGDFPEGFGKMTRNEQAAWMKENVKRS
jgi:hypothetical protein